MKDQVFEVLRDRIPYILFDTVLLFIGLCVCSIAVMRRRSGGRFYFWLGIWSAIEGTEYLFGSLADLGLLPNWLLPCLPYLGTIMSFSVVVIALLAFLNLSQDKLRLFFRGAIIVGLAIDGVGNALFLFTGSSFKIMPFNHLLAAISLTALAIVAAVPKLSRRFLVLPNRTVLSLGILLFAVEAVYGNLSLPLRLPSPPEILDPLGFAVLLFCFGYVAVQSLEISSSPSASFESVPIGSFWDELRAIFEWLHGVAVAARLAPFPIAGTVERERIFQTSGDVCLMATQEADGAPRSFLINGILGVSVTQRTMFRVIPSS